MKNNFAIYIAALLLGCYIILLIAITNYGQSQLLLAKHKELEFNIKQKAKTLEYFFERTKEEVNNLAHSKELEIYFANKALGMSMKYGLQSSLLNIERNINSAKEKQKINNLIIFKDIAILDLSDDIMVSTNKNINFTNIDFESRNFNEPTILAKNIDNSFAVMIVQAIHFKEEILGYLISEINIDTIFDQFTQDNDKNISLLIKDTEKNSIQCDDKNSQKCEKIILDIRKTPFQLIAHYHENSNNSILLSKWFILLLIFLSIPIFITIYYLIKFNNKNIRLKSEVIFSKESENILNEHNKVLMGEIIKRKESESKMYHQANYDLLTTLPNRFLFIDKLNQIIKLAEKTNEKIAIFFIDLDNFKNINDSLGHATGDIVLKNIAKRLKNSIRATDIASRLGGDEFTIIITEFNIDSLSIIANKIINNIQKEMVIDKNKFYITSSIGISLYPQDGLDANILLRNADAAMYAAKDDGKNKYKFYTKDMTASAFEYMEMESSLRYGLINEEFILYYQPQFNSITNQIIGIEALVRWIHPKIGMIQPDNFVPLAEKTGLIIPLGEQILKMAIRQIAIWKEVYNLDGVRMAINLSVKQIENLDIQNLIKKILLEYSCKPEWIELEITEGYIMKNPDIAINTLKSLKELGIEISIDDFGTGYSSLAYLKKLPIDKLKIDKSFVKDIQFDEDDRIIVESIILLASSMKLKVLAEGVEQIEQKKFLEEKGCTFVQGFLYSKPMLANDMEKLFNKIE